MQVKIRVPAVPSVVTVDIPGASKGVRMPVGKLSDSDIERLGKDWTNALQSMADAQRADESDPVGV